MIKHGMKFLFGHVRIGIKHLKTIGATKQNINVRNNS
jgi:hypothetical protein